MTRISLKPGNLREDCVAEALRIIEQSGLEGLSLREVARRLGVSHQAPYKHYPSRDHLLAEVVARAFAAFAQHLDQRPRHSDPHDDMSEMGRAYVGYSLAHPLYYRLMFGTPLPDPQQHPEMMRQAQHAFAQLQDCFSRLPNANDGRDQTLDALFVWSVVHGIASILQTSAVSTLALPPGTMASFAAHAFSRLRAALDAPPPAQ